MTDDELKAFIRAEVRKALEEELQRPALSLPRDLFATYRAPKAVAPPRSGELPAWARHEEGTAH